MQGFYLKQPWNNCDGVPDLTWTALWHYDTNTPDNTYFCIVSINTNAILKVFIKTE